MDTIEKLIINKSVVRSGDDIERIIKKDKDIDLERIKKQFENVIN